MACNLSTSRLEPCKDSVGGLQAVYFINYNDSASFASEDADGLITSLGASTTVYKYDLKGTSTYTETVNTSRENGTTSFTQEAVLNLKKLTNAMTKELKVLSAGRPRIIVHTNAGDALLVGRRFGADVTAGQISTGAALQDLYGYSITLQGNEPVYAQFLSGSTTTNPFAGVSGSITVATYQAV
jgi:hypothetical protein